MHILTRMIMPIIIGSGAVFIYIGVNFLGLNEGTIGVSDFYGEQFYSVLSTLYAIITALMLIKGLETFDELNSAINREAIKMRSINAYFYYFSPELQVAGGSIHSIRSLLLQYIQNILKQGRADKALSNDLVIDECILHCGEVPVEDENDRIALIEIMKGLDELRKLRAERINCSRGKVPGYLITMLVLMTVCIIAPFYLEHQITVHFNHYIIFVLTTFGSFIYFLLNDINRPYDGLWTIDMDPFKEAQTELGRNLNGWPGIAIGVGIMKTSSP